MEYAVYREQELEQYRGNPMIEALPPIPGDESEIIQHLAGFIKICTPEEKQMKPLLRIHSLNRIHQSFFYPFAQVRQLDTAIQMMIRSAYINRNPISAEYRQKLIAMDREASENNSDVWINAIPELGTVVYGVPGSGKTRALRQCLNYYPPLIRHTEYQGTPFTKTQIPWLMVDAPYDGDYVTFCRSVFKVIDERCGTNYHDKYGYSTYNPSTMILHMRKLLFLNNVGILIVDEVQNLLRCKNGSDEMMAFFVSLTNQLGVPIIFCGTSNAIKLFQKRMSLARRQLGAGNMKFEAIERDNSEWTNMMKYLWRGYILQEEMSLNEDLLDAFWDYSQGLIGIVVVLFCQVQIRALLSGRESFDIQLLKNTYDIDLAIIKPMLEAIKSGDEWKMVKYEDISFDLDITIKAGIEECKHQEFLEEVIAAKSLTIAQRRQSTSDSIYTTIRAIGVCDMDDKKLKVLIRETVDSVPDDTEESELLKAVLAVIIQPKPAKRSGKQIVMARNSGLLYVFEQSEKNHTDIHNDLLEYGYIKRIEDDFPDLTG